MPTWSGAPRFLRDLTKLTDAERRRFCSAVDHFVADLRAGQGLRPGLRVKRVQGADGVWELTWAPDGRATWEYGEEILAGEPHIIWRRVGTHSVFDTP